MKNTLSIIVAFAVVALMVGTVLTYKRSNTVAAKLAKIDNGVTRVDSASPNTLSVKLWSVSKADLDGVHCAAICDLGPSRIAFLKDSLVEDSASFGLNLPVAGETPLLGREWGGEFSYSYSDGEVECQFFDMPFRVSSQGVIHINGDTHHLNSRKLIVVDKNNKVIETRPFRRVPNA